MPTVISCLSFLSKYYFGAWQNLFCLNWPLRFLIEYILFGVILLLLLMVIRVLAKKVIVPIWCIAVREVVYLLGHEKNWAVEIDNRMIDWAIQKMNGSRCRRKNIGLKIMIILAVIFIYFLAVFADLPVARHISDEYLSDMQNIKAFFQQMETSLSKGYEQYPRLFISAAENEEATVEDIEPVLEEKKPVCIQLNDRGKTGSNIRSEPNLNDDGNIIGGVNENSEIEYREEWIYDGERYWLRVYISDIKVEGWLSGRLVDSLQLQEIVGNEETASQ